MPGSHVLTTYEHKPATAFTLYNIQNTDINTTFTRSVNLYQHKPKVAFKLNNTQTMI